MANNKEKMLELIKMTEPLPRGYKYHLIKKEFGTILASFKSKECCDIFIEALQYKYTELDGIVLYILKDESND